jgi:protein-disulfide isomerase
MIFMPEEERKEEEKESRPVEASGERPASGSSGPLGKLIVAVFFAALVGSWMGNSLAGGFTFALTGDAAADGTPEKAPPSQPATPPPRPQAGGSVRMSSIVDDDPYKGDENAPVTIVEFSDFQCPFCARFFSNTLSQIENDYISTGKVKLVYRDFPLSFHPNAQPAAEAAECAREQGKFWEFHDKIFENQQALSASSYKQWASELGLDTAKFNSCVDSGKYRSEVQKDFADGSALGASGTPTFFIGKSDGLGQKIVGAQPYSVFQQAIEAYL